MCLQRHGKKIQDLSHGLVEILGPEDNHDVRFIHQSVQDFCLKNALLRLYRSISLPTIRNRNQLVAKRNTHGTRLLSVTAIWRYLLEWSDKDANKGSSSIDQTLSKQNFLL